jgi:hypothetical protein
MMIPVDYTLLGLNMVIACDGALVNMMFTMAIFRDNLGRYCSAPLLVEEE